MYEHVVQFRDERIVLLGSQESFVFKFCDTLSDFVIEPVKYYRVSFQLMGTFLLILEIAAVNYVFPIVDIQDKSVLQIFLILHAVCGMNNFPFSQIIYTSSDNLKSFNYLCSVVDKLPVVLRKFLTIQPIIDDLQNVSMKNIVQFQNFDDQTKIKAKRLSIIRAENQFYMLQSNTQCTVMIPNGVLNFQDFHDLPQLQLPNDDSLSIQAPQRETVIIKDDLQNQVLDILGSNKLSYANQLYQLTDQQQNYFVKFIKSVYSQFQQQKLPVPLEIHRFHFYTQLLLQCTNQFGFDNLKSIIQQFLMKYLADRLSLIRTDLSNKIKQMGKQQIINQFLNQFKGQTKLRAELLLWLQDYGMSQLDAEQTFFRLNNSGMLLKKRNGYQIQ